MVIERKSAYDLHSSRWHFKARWTIEMSMGAFGFKEAMDMYISYKFGGLLFSTSAVNAAQLCSLQQASISILVNLSMFTRRRHVLCFAAVR